MSTKRHDQHWDGLKYRLQQTSLATAEAPERDEKRTRELYRQRADRLAAPVDESERCAGQRVPTLVFLLGEGQFGIPLRHVAQVCPARPLTPVPGAPAWLLGVAAFDAQIRSVVDMATLLETAAEPPVRTGGHLLLVRAADGTVAVRVDRVEEVRLVDFADLSASDRGSAATAQPLIQAATPQHLAIVCAETLVSQTLSPDRTSA